MDALGCRSVLCASCGGGVRHRLATLGVRYAGHRYADRAVSFYERRARSCRHCSREYRVETSDADPHHSSCDPGQRHLLPRHANYRARTSVTGRIHRCTPLSSLLYVGVCGSLARRCTGACDRRGFCHGHAHDDGCGSDREIAESLNKRMASLHRTRSERAKRALERMLEFQKEKAQHFLETGHDYSGALLRRSLEVQSKLEEFQHIKTSAPVLEVGSGAHGLIFFFGAQLGIGIDPLAHHYVSLFPDWQWRVPTVAAYGEALPFPDNSFEVVLSDDVVDYAEDQGDLN